MCVIQGSEFLRVPLRLQIRMREHVPIAFDRIDGIDFKRIGKHVAKLRRIGTENEDGAGVVLELLDEGRERHRVIVTAPHLGEAIADDRNMLVEGSFLRDYVVTPDPANPDVLLGRAYAAIGSARIPVSYFVLQRAHRGSQPAAFLEAA